MTLPGRLPRRLAPLVAAVVAVAGVALPALARPTLEEIQAKKQRVEQRAEAKAEQADTVATVVRSLDAERARAEARVRELEGELASLDDRIAERQRQLTKAQKRMAVLTAQLQRILARLGLRTDAFVERAVAAYKAGPTAYVEGVLSSQTFNDVIDRYEYYRAALDADSSLLDEIERLRGGVELRREEVERRQEEISEAKLALQSHKAAVEAVHDEKAAVLAQRRQAVDAKRELLASVRSKQQHLEAIVAQLEKDAAEQRAIIAAAGSRSSGSFPTGGGQLLWPAAGPLTSGYGYRTHPIFGDTRFHSGIDIGAPYGAPVVAADSGTVIYVGVMSGYGNAIVVDHGGGLATTYNHLSSFLVSSGQGVSRGSQIGAVGCSGYCTGPHLHFEVRVNGDPVDPMPYLQ